jgi:hypothetical protein
MDCTEILTEFRYHTNRLEIALAYTDRERDPRIKGICVRLRGLLDEIEIQPSARRTE